MAFVAVRGVVALKAVRTGLAVDNGGEVRANLSGAFAAQSLRTAIARGARLTVGRQFVAAICTAKLPFFALVVGLAGAVRRASVIEVQNEQHQPGTHDDRAGKSQPPIRLRRLRPSHGRCRTTGARRHDVLTRVVSGHSRRHRTPVCPRIQATRAATCKPRRYAPNRRACRGRAFLAARTMDLQGEHRVDAPLGGPLPSRSGRKRRLRASDVPSRKATSQAGRPRRGVRRSRRGTPDVVGRPCCDWPSRCPCSSRRPWREAWRAGVFQPRADGAERYTPDTSAPSSQRPLMLALELVRAEM